MATLSSNSAQLLYGSRVYEVLQYYYAPVTGGSTFRDNLYGFIGNVIPWDDEQNPPTPTQDQKTIKTYFKNIIAFKKIQSSDISPVVPKVDWTANTVYDYYDDETDILELDSNGILTKKFYAKNKFDQVFKCLGNAQGGLSTVEPQFLPGSYSSNFIIYGADGYKWKYMYTIDVGVKQKFTDSNWMPVAVSSTMPNPISKPSIGVGSVDVVNVSNTGIGYVAGGVTVTITGDGTGATATPTVNNAGYLTDVIVTNAGSNYTYANVVFTVSSTAPTPTKLAVASAPVSPVGGHGLDPISELGCNHVMITSEYNKDENGFVPTDLSFRQIGLILNPTAYSTNPYSANGTIYDATTHLLVSTGINNFVSGQFIYQGSNAVNNSFSGTIASFDSANNVVKVINTQGTPSINYPIIQDGNGPIQAVTRTLLQVFPTDIILNSGYMLYIENRSGVQRSYDGIEQFRLVLRF
jgi:hypothetical protein